MDRNWLLARHSELRNLRQPEEKLWRAIAELLRPDDVEFSGGEKNARSYDEIYDSSPLYALDNFVGGMFGQATNPASRWFEMADDDEDLMRYRPVKDWFYRVSSIMAMSCSPAVSSFYSEVPAWFADWGAFGVGTLYTEEDIGNERIVDRSIPLSESYIDHDIHGEMDTFHRAYKRTGRQILARWPGAIGVQEKRNYELIHAVFPNPKVQPSKMGREGMPWISVHFSDELKDFMEVKAYHEMPFFTPTWSKRSGKVWPRGPGHISLADNRSLQEMERIDLVGAQYMAEPPVALNAESDLTMADFQPNALLFGAIAENGKELARYLERKQNLQYLTQKIVQKREAIREAFLFTVMQLVNRPQMTATEFLGFQEEKLRLIGPHLTRIQTGGLSPFLARRFRILERAGQLPPPPPEIENRPIQINYISALAKAQKAQLGRATMQWIGNLSQIAQFKPEVMDKLNADAAADILHDAYGPPPALLNDDRMVEQARAQRNAQAQRQQALADAQQQTEIAAGQAHALQAETLAKGRQ